MWVSQIILENIRGFVGDENVIDLSKNINILVGQNNSGKSTILNTIYFMQSDCLRINDVSIGKTNGKIALGLKEVENSFEGRRVENIVCTFDKANGIQKIAHDFGGGGSQIGNLQNFEPFNPIYPYLSKRKTSDYSEDVRLQFSTSVTGNLQHLYAKIDRVSSPFFLPAHEEYRDACERILGFSIGTTASDSGKKAAYIIKNLEHIPLTSMGEGVSSLLGLIVDLCIAENKIFLIEEPENDTHPKALKALLELIEKKSANNQFIISTHSNIVTKYLGSVEGSKVFRVSMSFDENRLPVSKVEEVENEPNARLQLLEELGYEAFDFGQWKAWLILEESSAEVIIREFLIPTFVPKLKNKLKTYSARSLSEIELKFKDFNNLFVFVHLEQIYKNKAWVIIDAGEKEEAIINQLREMYVKSGWNVDQFTQFSEHDFERYYPKTFSDEVNEILALTDKGQKRERKKELVEKLKQWLTDNPEQAKLEFAESANEVIRVLKNIVAKI